MKRFERAATALVLLTAFVVLVPQAPSGAAPVRYQDVMFSSFTTATGIQYADMGLYSEDYEGNWALLEHFDGAVTTPIELHNSNWGRPWLPLSGLDVDVASGVAAPQSSDQTAVAMTSQHDTSHLDMWIDVDPNGGTARALFRAKQNGDLTSIVSYQYAEVDADAGTVSIGYGSPGSSETEPVSTTISSFPSGTVTLHITATDGDVTSGVNQTSDVHVVVNPSSDTDTTGAGNVTLDEGPEWAANQVVGFVGGSGQTFDDIRVWDPLTLDLLAPSEGSPPPARAAVGLFHGGGFSSGSATEMADYAEAFAARGYVATSVNYRLYQQLELFFLHPPNSHRLEITGATGGSVTVDVDDGNATNTADLDVGMDATDVEGALATAGAVPTGISVDVWGGPVGTNDVWFTWSGASGEFPYPGLDIESNDLTGSTPAATMHDYEMLLDQIQEAPACLTPPAWAVAEFGSGPLTGINCVLVTGTNTFVCPSQHGEMLPSESDDCDQGVQQISAEAVRAAVDDAQAATRWLRTNATYYGIDTSKVFVAGGSAGGVISTSLAYQPEDYTGGPHDDSGSSPNSGVSSLPDAAAPFEHAYLVNGDGEVDAGAPPVAILTRDFDTELYEGGGNGMTAHLIESARAAGDYVEYHGQCGYGHGIAPADVNPDLGGDDTTLPTLEGDQFINDISGFFLDAMNDEFDEDRLGVTFGGDGRTPSTDLTSFARDQLLGAADPADGDYAAVSGDFDGDGRDDVYFHHPDGECDSMWLGQADGTFATTPLRNDADFDPLPKNGITTFNHGPVLDDAPSGDAEPIVGDFNGDTRDDIFWFVPDGTSHTLWLSSSSLAATSSSLSAAAAGMFTVSTVTTDDGYDAAVAGDFGKGEDSTEAIGGDLYLVGLDASEPDVLLYGTSGTPTFLSVDMDTGFSAGTATGFTKDDIVPLVGNFDGADYDDIVWYGPSYLNDGNWYGQVNTDGTAADAFDEGTAVFTGVYTKAFVGDFGICTAGATGADDIYFFDVPSGYFAGYDVVIYGKSDQTFQLINLLGGFAPTVAADVRPVVGNFDDSSDDLQDIFFYGQGTGTDRVHYGNPATSNCNYYYSFTSGTPDPVGGSFEPLGGNFDLTSTDSTTRPDDIYWFQPD